MLTRAREVLGGLIPGVITGPYWGLTWLGLALAGQVGAAEAGAIVAEASPTGQYSPGGLFGPGQLTSPLTLPTAPLRAWAQASTQFPHLTSWLYAYVGFDLLALAGYVLAGYAVLAGRRSARAARWLLASVLAAGVAADLIAFAAFAGLRSGPVPAGILWALHAAAALRWAALIAFIAWAGYRAFDSARARREIRHVAVALKLQRFSLVIVVLLAVVAGARGSDVLEQMPDVQRAWLTPWLGWVHLLLAVAAQLMLAVLLLFLGRMRTRRAEMKYLRPHELSSMPANLRREYGPWLGVPAGLILIAAGLRAAGLAEVSWQRIAAVAVVGWGVAAASAAADFYHWRNGRTGVPPLGHGLPQPEPAMVDMTRTVGDVLAVAVVAVTGLGLVRSFTAPALVVGGGYAVESWLAVVIGIAVAAGAWHAADRPVRGVVRLVARSDSVPGRLASYVAHGGAPQGTSLRTRWLLALTVAGPFLVPDVLLLFLPLATTHVLGVLGTMVIAFGTLGVGLALLAYLAQTSRPLSFFRVLRLNATPAITLLVVISLLGSMFGRSAALHEIRGPAVSGAPAATGSANPGLLPALGSWLADPLTTACAIPAGAIAGTRSAPGSTVQVEPLVLVAASGGGIRAAWWTVRSLTVLARWQCGRHAVFAASGVSGGSVGLTVLATSPRPADAIAALAGPSALAAAIDGLLLHDTIASFTGVDLAAAQLPSGQRFADRAALMERAWEQADAGLTAPFPLAHPVLPWQLLLNSTAVGTGCRAILASGPLPALPGLAGRAGRASTACSLTAAVPASGSYDFFAALPCLKGIATSTAALLSARFPYVTPSGVVTGCGPMRGRPVEQYVDGGYADSSGLSTLAELAPALMAQIRLHNEQAVAGARAGQPVTLVVPVTLYLRNSVSAEPVARAASVASELTIPTHARSAAVASQLAGSDALLQAMLGVTGPDQWLSCAPADTPCLAALAAAKALVPDQLIVVAPRELPSVSAPLGWVLSEPSRIKLDAALAVEAAARCTTRAQPARFCPVGVGRLGDLVALIGRPSASGPGGG